MTTIAFLHAHPDDEAIFTGGAIARLARLGHRVVVIYATSGELGRGAGPGLAPRRRTEAHEACAILGAARAAFLDHHDSGIDEDRRDRPWGAFSDVALGEAADHVAAIVAGEGAEVLVTYDERGVYGHPDHVHAHHVGAAAATRAGLATWYEVTLDREYLHFVDTHVAAAARSSLRSRPDLGSVTAEITTTVDVRDQLHLKHAAIAAHRSQVEDDPTFGASDAFADVYGFEWFVRHGPPAVLDELHLDTTRTTTGAVRV